MSLKHILDNRSKYSGRSKNKYGGRTNAVFSKEPKRPRFKLKLKLSSLLGLFSVASIVTVCAILFVLVALSLIFGYRYLTTSEHFAIKNIEVAGVNNLTYTEILKEAGIDVGINSLAISIDDVEAKLLKNPWVEEVSVKRSLPDTVSIKIKERQAKFWILRNGVMYYGDGVGDLIMPLEADKFLSLPVLEVAKDSEYLAARLEETLLRLEAVLNTLPEEFRKPSLYKISQAGGIEVHIEGKHLHIGLGLEDLDGNVKRISLALADLARRGELDSIKEVRAHGGKVWVIAK